jgi:hypothetical protein
MEKVREEKTRWMVSTMARIRSRRWNVFCTAADLLQKYKSGTGQLFLTSLWAGINCMILLIRQGNMGKIINTTDCMCLAVI